MSEVKPLYGPPAKLCPNCERPVTVKGSTFCGVACANASRKRPATNGRFCKACGIPLYSRQKTACCKAHSYMPPTAKEPTTPSKAVVKPPSAASNSDNIEAVKRLRAAGKYRLEIAAELGLSKHTVQTIIQQHDIPRPDVPRVSDRSPAKPTAKRRPITIPLREVIRWAFDLGCRRGASVDEVSRAMRREDPSHPGFVLGESPRGMSWSKNER